MSQHMQSLRSPSKGSVTPSRKSSSCSGMTLNVADTRTSSTATANIGDESALAAPALLAKADSPREEDNRTWLQQWPGGWRPYSALTGGFCLMFISWGYVNAYGTNATFYDHTLMQGLDKMRINLIGATQCFMILGLSFIVGRLVDASHITKVLTTGTCLVALGTFLLAIVDGRSWSPDAVFSYVWATQGFITGCGMACFFVPSSWVVATWFHEMKSTSIGIVATGASVGGAIFSIMTRYLIEQASFRVASLSVAAVMTFLAALATFIAKPNTAPRRGSLEKDMDNTPEKQELWRAITGAWDRHALKDSRFVWVSASTACIFLGFYAIFFNIEDWAAYTGVAYREATRPSTSFADAIKTFLLLTVMNASSSIGRIASAATADHLGNYGALHVHALCTGITSILCLVFWVLAKTVGTALGFVVVFGAFSGAVIGLPPASMAYILDKNDPVAQAKLGQWVGMMYTIAAPFALAGPVIAGHLISTFGFLSLQLWSGVSLLAACGCMLMAVLSHHRHLSAKAAAEIEAQASVNVTNDMLPLSKEVQ
ncbi:hypothetical protein BAUCODRAFT_30450 [Baudoinia panamericana UAMH 10762]|uniref:Major facilitator superfamily (MFS) profile domain-containing protein n=1 Tax=Baudoinia panamericana (strain UAMH 10762) TaxID=717646 RepID=M2NLJ8_BAUPA|nr:uncharacterized protein BAUCODRAFT_30450 [Baudoinia panamericana UAMH 10762]EMD00011.1 hypothetical protein BAUCODRAFT_30450 [Baudoinia panamericana UAMH 10762]